MLLSEYSTRIQCHVEAFGNVFHWNITATTGLKQCQMRGNWSERYSVWSRWKGFEIREPWSNAPLSLMNEHLMLMTVSTKCSWVWGVEKLQKWSEQDRANIILNVFCARWVHRKFTGVSSLCKNHHWFFFILICYWDSFYHKSGRKTLIDERFFSKTRSDWVCESTFPGQKDLCG